MSQASASSSSSTTGRSMINIPFQGQNRFAYPISNNRFIYVLLPRGQSKKPSMKSTSNFKVNMKTIGTGNETGAARISAMVKHLEYQYNDENSGVSANGSIDSLKKLNPKDQTAFFQALYLHAKINHPVYSIIHVATAGYETLKKYAKDVNRSEFKIEQYDPQCDQKYDDDDMVRIMKNQFQYLRQASYALTRSIHFLGNNQDILVARGVENGTESTVNPKEFLNACLAGLPVAYRTHISTSIDLKTATSFATDKSSINLTSEAHIRNNMCGYLDVKKPDQNAIQFIKKNIEKQPSDWKPNILMFIQTKKSNYFFVANDMFDESVAHFKISSKPDSLNPTEWQEILDTFGIDPSQHVDMSSSEDEVVLNPPVFKPEEVFALNNFNLFIVSGHMQSYHE